MFNPQIAHSVIDHALGLGADFAELFIERQIRSSVETLSGAVKDVNSGIDFGIGVRLIFGFKVLYGYTNKADGEELKRIVSELAALDRRAAQPASFNFQQHRFANLHSVSKPLSTDHLVASKVEFLLAAEQAARNSEQISQVTGSVSQREQQITLFNSEGLEAHDTRHYCRARTTAIAEDGQQQATGYNDDGGLIGWELEQRMDAQAMGEDAARMALVNLSAQPCPSGRMPVIIGNGFGGVIFHEACGHLLETTSVAKQASVFHDRLGDMIANPVVNAVDDGTMANEWGSINIDDEGMATQKTQLIKNGRLVNFLADRQGALQTGLARSGSGRRESYKFAPASRMRNTFIEPGNDRFDDMIASIDKGIYAARMGGGSVQPGTGEFNFAVTEGYYVENGKVQYPVKSATLISTGPQVLQEISMVSDDFKLACGMCGSVSGAVPTTVGQPALKVDDILVGGQA